MGDVSVGDAVVLADAASGATATGGETAALLLWWEQLSTCALVGSGRRPVPPMPAVFEVLARPGADPESELLDQLALGVSWHAAGFVPDVDVVPPPPAPEEHRPLAPDRAMALLELILSQPPGGASARTENLALWARECDRTGARVAHRVLPALLEAACADRSVTRLVAPILGERGRWLAALNPAWRRIADGDGASADVHPQTGNTQSGKTQSGPGADGPVSPVGTEPGMPADWPTWPVETQVSRLMAYRAGAPRQALALVVQVWRSAPAKDRLRYLDVVARGVNPDDEEFLEAALDDRAAGVRARAAELLGGLPTSARAGRMAARLSPLVSMEGRLRKVVTVALPDDPDAQARRDGLGSAPPPGRRMAPHSRRAQDLYEIVASAPLAVWAQTGFTPSGVLDKLADTAERHEVLAGLRRAAEAQRHTEWATALLRHGELSPGLLGLLDEPAATGFILARLADAAPDERLALVGHLPFTWNLAVSNAVVRTLSQKDTPPLATSHALTAFGDRFDPGVTAALQTWLDRLDHDSPVRTPVARLLTTLAFHQSIREAFA